MAQDTERENDADEWTVNLASDGLDETRWSVVGQFWSFHRWRN
jgi:hypothetical protein